MEGGVCMISKLYNQDEHLSKDNLIELKDGSLDDNKLMIMLDYISVCESCADAFSNIFSENELACAPMGFAEEVQRKIKNKKQSNIQFINYSIRVAFAACFALIIVFSSTFYSITNVKNVDITIKPINLSVVNSINGNLKNFSQSIIKMEVFHNEKEKK